MTDYIKVKSGEYEVIQLQTEVNSDLTIVPSCTAISAKGNQLTLTFAAALSGVEETALDTVISNHVPAVEDVPATLLPRSSVDGFKLAVHSSSKPEHDQQTFAMWTGSGDDLNDPQGQLCGGEMLEFDCDGDQGSTEIKRLKFNPIHGKVWVHEAYLRFENGGQGDFIEAFVVAEPTPLQQAANLDLVVDGEGYISLSPGGPGTGTHGFADATKIQLLPRTFSKDGDWDYSEAGGLVPNLTGTGQYKICENTSRVHRYYSKIPCHGTCSTYFSMTSDDTAWLAPGFYVEIIAHKNSTNDWMASIIVEIYRERTYLP